MQTPEELLDAQRATWYDEDGSGQVAYSNAVNAIINAMVQENRSMLEMAERHMDERACMVLRDRIFSLEKYYHA
jgi:hypothetical protein